MRSKISRVLAVLLLFALGLNACAAKRPPWKYDLADILEQSTGPGGEPVYSFNVERFDYVINRFAVHARIYPPRFSSKREQAEITDKMARFVELLAIVETDLQDDVGFLVKTGFVYHMCHNLDIQGCGSRARTAFERALTLDPENAEAHHKFGIFIISSAQDPSEAILHLRKALDSGVTDAAKGLATAHLFLDERDKAIEMLELYLESRPNDDAAKAMLDLLKKNVPVERRDL